MEINENGFCKLLGPQDNNGTQEDVQFTNLMQGCTFSKKLYEPATERNPNISWIEFKIKCVNGEIVISNAKITYEPGAEVGTILECPMMEHPTVSEPYKPGTADSYPITFSIPVNKWKLIDDYNYEYKDWQELGNEESVVILLDFKPSFN